MNFHLPESVAISPEMLRLISEVDEFKGQWRVWRALTPERLEGLKRVATIESIGSSTRIEGSHLTDREVEVLLGRLETTSFATRDEQEVAGYAFPRLDASRPTLSPLARELGALFETKETLTNREAAALTGASRSTLKAKFAELIKAGVIEAQGKGRGAFYFRSKRQSRK